MIAVINEEERNNKTEIRTKANSSTENERNNKSLT